METTQGSAEGKKKGGPEDAEVCSMLPAGHPQGAACSWGKLSWTPPFPTPTRRMATSGVKTDSVPCFCSAFSSILKMRRKE